MPVCTFYHSTALNSAFLRKMPWSAIERPSFYLKHYWITSVNFICNFLPLQNYQFFPYNLANLTSSFSFRKTGSDFALKVINKSKVRGKVIHFFRFFIGTKMIIRFLRVEKLSWESSINYRKNAVYSNKIQLAHWIAAFMLRKVTLVG